MGIQQQSTSIKNRVETLSTSVTHGDCTITLTYLYKGKNRICQIVLNLVKENASVVLMLIKLYPFYFCTGRAIGEMGKDKPNAAHVESFTKNFLTSLRNVEKSLAEQINYLSQVATGQPHEGSSYSAQKDAQMSIHRLEHAKSKLNELKMTCAQSIAI